MLGLCTCLIEFDWFYFSYAYSLSTPLGNRSSVLACTYMIHPSNFLSMFTGSIHTYSLLVCSTIPCLYVVLFAAILISVPRQDLCLQHVELDGFCFSYTYSLPVRIIGQGHCSAIPTPVHDTYMVLPANFFQQ